MPFARPLYFDLDHDPSGQLDERMFALALDAGASVIAASVTVVDGNDQPLPPMSDSDLVVSFVSFGAITDPVLLAELLAASPADVGDNIWGVTFYLRNGIVGMTYFLRLRYTLDSNPPGVGDDITMRIYVRNK